VTARRLALALPLAVLLPACAHGPARVVSIEVPAASPLGIGDDAVILVADFEESGPAPDLSLGRDVADYLAREMKAVFRGTVSRRPSSANARAAAPASGRDILLCGEVQLLQESQKALREAGLPSDGPFELEGRGFVERKKFTLKIACRVFDEARGEMIFEKALSVTRAYDNLRTAPDYALVDLLPLLKARLFPDIFGRPSFERRTLLLRPPGSPSAPL
jgi:hypothetical protein